MIGVAVASKINIQAGTIQTNTNAQTAPPPLSPPRTHKHNSPSSLLPLPCFLLFLFTILPLCALCCSCPMWRQDEQHAPSTKHQPELDLHSENAGKLLQTPAEFHIHPSTDLTVLHQQQARLTLLSAKPTYRKAAIHLLYFLVFD